MSQPEESSRHTRGGASPLSDRRGLPRASNDPFDTCAYSPSIPAPVRCGSRRHDRDVGTHSLTASYVAVRRGRSPTAECSRRTPAGSGSFQTCSAGDLSEIPAHHPNRRAGVVLRDSRDTALVGGPTDHSGAHQNITSARSPRCDTSRSLSSSIATPRDRTAPVRRAAVAHATSMRTHGIPAAAIASRISARSCARPSRSTSRDRPASNGWRSVHRDRRGLAIGAFSPHPVARARSASRPRCTAFALAMLSTSSRTL